MRKLQSLARRFTRSDDRERGAALPFVAVLLVLLLGVAAFAVDLGWIYLNGARLQRAADSSALAGVVFLPSDIPEVVSSAIDGASANGWDVGTVNGAPIAGGGPEELDWQQLADNKLEVTLSATVPTFFLQVLGFDNFDLSRTATAEYVKPVPIGSPFQCFGEAPGVSASQCPDPNFWAAIQMPYTAKEHGDAYQSLCLVSTTGVPGSCTAAGNNPEYDSDGYYYAIEVEGGTPDLQIWVYDATFWRRPVGGSNCGTFPETGDCDVLGGTSRNGTQNTHFQVYRPDSTPLDPSDNVAISGCRRDVAKNNSSYLNQWVTVCSLGSGSVEAGIYVMRVWTSGNSGGSNHYSVTAGSFGGSTQPRVYGIDRISIFTNQPGATGTLYLAEVAQVHAGKKLELRFFDAGEDNSGNAYMTVKKPDGTTANCDWNSKNEAGTQTDSGSGACRIETTTGGSANFNAQWITAVVDIPGDYTCGPDCWWNMEMELNTPHDRTTWEARIIGNPIHLVPNEP